MNLQGGGERNTTPLPRSGSEPDPFEPRGFAASGWRSGSLQASQQPAGRNAPERAAVRVPWPASASRNGTGAGHQPERTHSGREEGWPDGSRRRAGRAAWKAVRNPFGGPDSGGRHPPTHYPFPISQLPALFKRPPVRTCCLATIIFA
jgi:hypothetical protein